MAKYKINHFKLFYLTGKKEVGSAISNINDEAVINNDVNDDIQVGEQLESASSQPYSNKYFKKYFSFNKDSLFKSSPCETCLI